MERSHLEQLGTVGNCNGLNVASDLCVYVLLGEISFWLCPLFLLLCCYVTRIKDVVIKLWFCFMNWLFPCFNLCEYEYLRNWSVVVVICKLT